MINIMEDTAINSREDQYNEYLRNHIRGVSMAWEQFLLLVFKRSSTSLLSGIRYHIDHHDESKYSTNEWNAYLDEFYPEVSGQFSDTHKAEYDAAWLHHQKSNPHHWQYWLLVRDSGTIEPLDMPLEYIIEMLCDWHSFSLRDPFSTAYSWYQDNKDKMIMSDYTRDQVERYIEYLKEPIMREDSNDKNN